MALLYLLLIALCSIIIWRASDGFSRASEYLGRNLSEGVRGATINAIGSSIPELLTTVFFLFAVGDTNGFAGGIGTTAGSAVFNSMIIPSLVVFTLVGMGIISAIHPSRKVVLRDGIALVISEVVLIMFISGSTLDWWHGGILMLMYFIYLAYMFTSMKKKAHISSAHFEPSEKIENYPSPLKAVLTLDLGHLVLGKKKITKGLAWSLLFVATLVLAVACYYLVFACEGLGKSFGIPVYFVAVILAAIATSLPDTFLSIRDGIRGHHDDAISNALGSNIFDICFALGFPLFLYTLIYHPISMTPDTIANTSELRVCLLLTTVGALGIFIIGRKVGLFKAALLTAIYLFFVLFVVGRALGWESLDPIGEWMQRFAAAIAV
jgi:cation:H+ antiporter